MTLLMDRRWEGPHGIGRFATEIAQRLPHESLPLAGRPLDLWDPLRLKTALSRHPQALFLSPGFNPPLGRPCPFFLTLHDLIHLSSPIRRLWYDGVIRPALKRADGVFTVSEFSKRGILEWSGLEPHQITVVGNGVSNVFTPEGPTYQAPRPYFLAVGNPKPHKNLEALIRAFVRSGLGEDRDLRLTGPPSPELLRRLPDSKLQDGIHFEGRVTELQLAALYRGAIALVLPSRMEGFGLPLIEAMASGTAVIASDRGALPEIGGNACRYVDPDREESLVEALRAFVDPTVRAPFVALGLVRAKDFHWDGVAARIQQRLKAVR